MKGRKLLAVLMSLTLVLATPLTIHAEQTIDVSTGADSGSSDTSFSATADMLGGGLTVVIPDEIVLTYDAENSVFDCTTQVTAKGYIEVNKSLEVSVPTDITYTLENFSTVTAAGTITFGVTEDTNQVESWTQTELKTKDASDNVVGVAKDFYVSVPEANVLDIGTYTSIVNFTIELLEG